MKLFKRKKDNSNEKFVEKDHKKGAVGLFDDEEATATQLENKVTIFDLIAPDGIRVDSDDYGIIKQSLGTDTYFRPFYIPRDGYPRSIQTDWLNNLLSIGEIDITVDIHNEGKAQAMRSLDAQMTMLASNLDFQRKRGNIDQERDLQAKIRDSSVLMDEIQFGDNGMYQVSTMGVVYANSKKELDTMSEFLEDEMSGSFIKIASTWNRVKSGLKSVLPIGSKNTLYDTYRNVDRRALSTFSPFISGSGRFNGGIPLGVNKITGHIEFMNSFGNDQYRPPNYNMGVTGIPGSGKSLMLKIKLARETALNDVWSMIIDPEDGTTRS